MNGARVLAGPPLASGAEPFEDHRARLGPLPRGGRSAVIHELEQSGLLGRGGAGFPVGRKWRSVAERSDGRGAVVLVNGAEGEPLSHKDRTLLALRPHLVLDGAQLAADAVGADEVILYVGEAHDGAVEALQRAGAERIAARAGFPVPVRISRAPDRYVAGEESAAVHFVNAGDARPITTPPRPYERGVAGLPTLVQNVESLAHAALIARRGAAWYREAGRGETRGTAVITVTAPGGRPRVREIELGQTIGEVAATDVAGEAAPRLETTQAVLLGGYFGRWVGAERAWDLQLDPAQLRADGLALGAGIVAFLSNATCPIIATARIAEYMAAQSAAQCGPCVFGLRSIADAMGRLARLEAHRDDWDNVERWAAQVRNRGACRHPDGAVGMLESALMTFDGELERHWRTKRCAFAAIAGSGKAA
ncbi:MAG TPA: NADH-ubiquinone oxidoreductase-F iron-sulfur binding region domain-containing protein [Candidatus Limnocylindrales bacterium]|nr:NADH-ubiquinone oxidoreductase-F iron-sulfur binding region domain-containing protein [Candidatus Limnocylindrales bacterium]